MKYIMHTDGACRPTNPGYGAAAVIVSNERGEFIEQFVNPVEKLMTNNAIEYLALIEALWQASLIVILGLGSSAIAGREAEDYVFEFIGDSKIVFCQMRAGLRGLPEGTEVWECKSPVLLPLWREAIELRDYLINKGAKLKFTVVPREQNTVADAAAGKVADEVVARLKALDRA